MKNMNSKALRLYTRVFYKRIKNNKPDNNHIQNQYKKIFNIDFICDVLNYNLFKVKMICWSLLESDIIKLFYKNIM